jgi:hypothetical protein
LKAQGWPYLYVFQVEPRGFKHAHFLDFAFPELSGHSLRLLHGCCTATALRVCVFASSTADLIVIGPLESVKVSRVFLHRRCAVNELSLGRPISVQYALVLDRLAGVEYRFGS